MNTAFVRISILTFSFGCGSAFGDQIPHSAGHDHRVGIVDYISEQVYTIYVAQGVVTRITLSKDETIKESATGFVSDCKSGEWCIKSEKGDNQIWVKPFPSSTINNLEVSTTKRDYSFRFIVVPGAEKNKNAFYRVVFRYPLELPNLSALGIANAVFSVNANVGNPASAANLESGKSTASKFPTPEVRNYKYSKKGSAESIAPSVIFDDGRFTYLRFPKGREVPAAFIVADGQEIRTAFHAERLSSPAEDASAEAPGDYMVLHKVAAKIILRLGNSVLELINDGMGEGKEVLNGTTDSRFSRDSIHGGG